MNVYGDIVTPLNHSSSAFGLEFFHHTLDQLFGIGEIFHDELTSMTGLPGQRWLWQYTPCCPTRAMASVTRSMVTARRPRGTPMRIS